MELSLGNLDVIKSDEYAPIPAGNYQLRAVGIELKDTRAGTGKYFNVEFNIIGGQYDGRKIWEAFNVINQNATTVEIALKQIKQWLIAAGQDASGELTSTRILNLEGSTCMAIVGIKTDKTGQYAPSNNIKRFISADAMTMATAPATNNAPPQPQTAPPIQQVAPQHQAAPPATPWQQPAA